MISCRTLARLLLGYVEQELPGECCELVEQHLASCDQCVALADSYAIVLQLVQRLQPVPVPAELLEALRIAAGLDLPLAALHPPWPEPY